MSSSSHNRFEVFAFREEDEFVGKMDIKLQSRMKNPKVDESPGLKYNFLACVANGSDFDTKGSVGVQCVDVNSNDDDEHCSVNVAMQTLTIPVEHGSSRPLLGYNGLTDAAFEPSCLMNENVFVHGSSITDMDTRVSSPGGHISEDVRIRSPLSESPTNSRAVNSTTSNPVLSIKDRSRSSPGVCADLHTEDQTFRGLDMEETGSAVALHADYVSYKGNYYPTALLMFSDRSIKVESSDMDKDVEALMFEWAVDGDVVSIESQWYARGSVVQIHVLAKGMVQTENVQNASGIEELKVMLFDPDWLLNLEKIFSLNVRYKDAWDTHSSSEIADDGVAFPIDKTELSLRPYFPDFNEHFDEVIYPELDVDAVSISKRDVDLLQPETFINDTIIDFYIKYLKSKIPTAELCRFHFFNSFFFRKLADLDKNPDSAFDGKAAFYRVRKWTRKLNLFEKDYIFIPVNYSYHWSLIVICHPGEVADFAVEKLNESSRVPCILHMDSIRGSHTGLKSLIQSYLSEEWKERQKETSEDISSKFLNLRFLSLELPQQENCYDCGLFLLHYVELFVEDAPVNFNPYNITKFSNFLTADWFIRADVSLKRPRIQRLIHEILTNRSQGSSRNSVGAEGDVHKSSKLEEDSRNDNGIELSSLSCNPKNKYALGSLYSGPGQGFDMNLPGGSPVRLSQCISQPGLALGDLFESGTSGSLFDQYQRYDLGSQGQPRDTMSPIEEEDDEDNEDPLYSMQSGSSLRELDGLTSENCNMELFGTVSSWDQSFDGGEHDQEDNSSPNSDYDSDDDEVKVIEENSPPTRNEKSDAPKCLLVERFNTLADGLASSSSEMETPAEDSLQYLNGRYTRSEQEDPFPSGGEDEHQRLPQELEDQGVGEEDERLIVNDSSADSDELQPAKSLSLCLQDETGPEHQQSPQEPEGQGVAEEDEILIAKDSSSDSDKLQPAKRLRLAPDDETGPDTDLVKDVQP